MLLKKKYVYVYSDAKRIKQVIMTIVFNSVENNGYFDWIYMLFVYIIYNMSK